MKPGRITLIFACVITALAVICAIFPSDGVTVGKHSYYLPTIHSLAYGQQPCEPMPADSLQQPTDSDTLCHVEAQPLNHSTLPHDSLAFWLPDESFFAPFWEAAEQAQASGRIVRIMHYGDSQIEMDHITSRLRTYMQKTFGGGGPGMLPFRTIIPTLAVRQSASGSLIHLASFGDSTVTRSRGNYGPMMQSFRMTGEATVNFKASNQSSVDDRLKRFSDLQLVFNNRGRGVRTYFIDRDHKLSDTLRVDTSGVGSLTWHADSGSTSVRLRTVGTADLYCVTLDDGPGVAVDNIPMRGCSGQQFTLVNQEFLTQSYAQFDIGIIILQFGGNSVPYLRSEKSISTYCRSIGHQIDYLHRCCPQAKILFIGPSDMSTRHRGVLQTYPMLPTLIDSLAATAISHDAAFWSIYHAMGGHNSMVEWNRRGLAGSDYIHFSQRGADLMGDRLAEAFAKEYKKWKRRKEK